MHKGEVLFIEHAIVGTETQLLNGLLNDPEVYDAFPPFKAPSWTMEARTRGTLDPFGKAKIKGRTFPHGRLKIFSPVLTRIPFKSLGDSNCKVHVYSIDEGLKHSEYFCIVYATCDIAKDDDVSFSFEMSTEQLSEEAAKKIKDYTNTHTYASLCIRHNMMHTGCYIVHNSKKTPKAMVTPRYIAFLQKHYDTCDPRIGLLHHHSDIRKYLKNK